MMIDVDEVVVVMPSKNWTKGLLFIRSLDLEVLLFPRVIDLSVLSLCH